MGLHVERLVTGAGQAARGVLVCIACLVLFAGAVQAREALASSEGALGGGLELVMFEQGACHWCEAWDEQIGGIYHKTDEGRRAPLRRVDIHDRLPADLQNVRKASFTPTFVLVENGREVGRIRGYPGADFFFPLLAELLKKVENGEKLQKAQR